MARYRFKAFDPKPFEPGARIEWSHRCADGRTLIRTGIVWSAARPLHRGRAVWVTPDEALPTDLYRAIYVDVPARRKGASAYALMPNSSDTGECGTATEDAARIARLTRAENARRLAA